MSASSRCSTSRRSSFARIIMRSGCQTTSRVIPPSPLTSFPPVRALSASPFPDMTGSNMPLNSERLCHRPVAGEHPLAVAVALDLRVPLCPALARGSVHERGRGFGELPVCSRPRRARPSAGPAPPPVGVPAEARRGRQAPAAATRSAGGIADGRAAALDRARDPGRRYGGSGGIREIEMVTETMSRRGATSTTKLMALM